MNKLVFITGASSGIGQALALRFYQAGWNVALVARRTQAIHDWAQSQQLDSKRYGVYGADVAQTDSIVQAGQDCIAAQGLPDLVIANAGVSIGVDSAMREDIDVFCETLMINNVGVVATFHPFINGMKARGSGVLVGIASMAAIRGLPGHGAYCASKAGVVAYCESLRGELRGTGVQVSTILPGYIATPLTSHNTYSMPFLLQPAEFANRAYRAMVAGNSYCVIPWQMGIVAKIMRLLPNALFDKIFAGKGRKKRKSEIPTP